MAVLNTLNINGTDYFVSPEDYTYGVEGSPSSLVTSSGGYIIDVGYVRETFTARIIAINPSEVLNLQTTAITAITNGTPITVVDNVYPGGKTWTGYFRLPIISNGSMKAPFTLGLGIDIMITPITVGFFNLNLERM